MFRALCHFPPDVLSVAGDEGGKASLLPMANARNASFQSLHGGSVYLSQSFVFRFPTDAAPQFL